MAEVWRYRGQEIDSEQLFFLREFIRTHPTSSRWKLSRQLCEALGWKQANGALRDMVLSRDAADAGTGRRRSSCRPCAATFEGSAGRDARGRKRSCSTLRR